MHKWMLFGLGVKASRKRVISGLGKMWTEFTRGLCKELMLCGIVKYAIPSYPFRLALMLNMAS